MTPEQLATLRKLAVEKNHGRGQDHAEQVRRLSLRIYDELVTLGIIDKAYAGTDK